jgi:hypothetical protein
VLIEDEKEYWRESAASRAAALEFVSGLDAADFERLLLSLQAAAKAQPAGVAKRLGPREIKLLKQQLQKRRGAAQ